MLFDEKALKSAKFIAAKKVNVVFHIVLYIGLISFMLYGRFTYLNITAAVDTSSYLIFSLTFLLITSTLIVLVVNAMYQLIKAIEQNQKVVLVKADLFKWLKLIASTKSRVLLFALIYFGGILTLSSGLVVVSGLNDVVANSRLALVLSPVLLSSITYFLVSLLSLYSLVKTANKQAE